MILKNKKIVLAVSGGIAAYKSAVLCRLLVQSGANVRVVMTRAATDFIGPVTLATLSKHPVATQLVKNRESGEWENHVELASWADLLLVAPATANTIAKMCTGLCDNLLLAVYLSARSPVMVAPAMDLDMWAHPTTSKNMATLRSHGVSILEPESGFLASGLEGKGRMMEPESILIEVENRLMRDRKWQGKRVLVTAGPTHEKLDPVRFIGNYSTGKMGYALARNLVNRGAEVILVSGPTAIVPPDGLYKFIQVKSAREMYKACLAEFDTSDLAILSAAVADYRPEKEYREKVKKSSDQLQQIELVENPDILATLGEKKKPHQKLVGFALETEKEETNARKKLKNKNLDLIVLNSLKDPGAGFGTDTNQVKMIFADGSMKSFEKKLKQEVAEDIINELEP